MQRRRVIAESQIMGASYILSQATVRKANAAKMTHPRPRYNTNNMGDPFPS
jgi:hypothetical protein